METISVDDQILGFIDQAANSARDDFDRFGRWGVTPIDAGFRTGGRWRGCRGFDSFRRSSRRNCSHTAWGLSDWDRGCTHGRGAEQLCDALQHPMVHESRKQLLGDFLADITPGGRSIESFLGGLPQCLGL